MSMTLEDSTYGRRAVLNSPWSDELIAPLAQNAIAELELNMAKGWKGNDLSFLTKLPGLLSLEILDLTIRNIEDIHCLHNLKRLGVTTYCSTMIDFTAFSQLESCSLEWRAKAASIFDCSTLKHLFVNRYPGRDCSPFTKLANLESLAILNAPLEHLHGLGALTRLQSLRLAGLRRLASLDGIQGMTNLRDLEIHTCRHIGSIKEIASLLHLKKLHLNNDGNIESLKPLDSLHELHSVLFYESTNIADGDLSPLCRQKNLTSVSFQNRRHYSHRREDFGKAYFG